RKIDHGKTRLYSAVPKLNHDLKILHWTKYPEGGKWRIYYVYSGNVIVESSSPDRYVTFLPINPDTIYEAGGVTQKTVDGEKRIYPCTDKHYDDEDDFWYFWFPFRSGCTLKENVDFERVTGTLLRSPNTKVTYPEYDRLADADGVIRIDVLHGMSELKNDRDPLKSKDDNAATVRALQGHLLKIGFAEKIFTNEQTNALLKDLGAAPMTEPEQTWLAEYTKKTPKGVIRIRVSFGPSQIGEEPSRVFHYLLKESFKTAGVLIYNGHSGLGGNLDTHWVEEEEENFHFEFPENKYQIYDFDSCTSYSYYNSRFFGDKGSIHDLGGTKNLDIIANGLETAFNSLADSSIILVDAVDQYATGKGAKSYQDIAQAADSQNLLTINGDEDNPTSPPN
ncbi:MAG: hypothetical protein ACXWPM_11540, partial [Bdellovibrionota bacterium]